MNIDIGPSPGGQAVKVGVDGKTMSADEAAAAMREAQAANNSPLGRWLGRALQAGVRQPRNTTPWCYSPGRTGWRSCSYRSWPACWPWSMWAGGGSSICTTT
ncbi:MAG: hypothetical protein WDM92_04685 [Caulobacteraceae bacterium]